MSDPYIGEIKLFAYDWAPKGWAICAGQIMAIATNQALFSLLGTSYGGNGVNTFALPDLRGRAPVHQGQGSGLVNKVMGEVAGQENVTLIQSNMPTHLHVHQVVTNVDPLGQSPASSLYGPVRGGYSATPDLPLSPATVAMAGGSQPHNNMPPYLVMNYCIATQGIFPSRA